MRIKKNYDFNRTDYENLKVSDLKSMADYWLRQYLIKTARVNIYGQILCPVKKRYFKPEYMHASHFIDRAVMSTRYDLRNVHLVSVSSNVWDAKVKEKDYKSKHHKEYENWLKEKLGKIEFNNLLEKSKERVIFARQDYIETIEFFKSK